MAKKSKENKIIEICSHNISYYYKGYDGEMPESEQEHVKELICEGFNQGELCMYNHSGTKEYRGWWHIEK
jgi:hypothetical protein